ncbi:hypothetical protein RHMOL_Rhmol10G0217900 [Rhododendron molle]|uniref:Uncharacterized protein n=1 Tax=Rhododendron molle TaxID=49168 RepID=A0ACC0M4J5_RHOML|nr:hypothetical protein RHMOL_Rhmol10G0217900 [Rhododendron molle]
MPEEVAGAEEEPQDIHRSPPLHAPPPISVPPLPHLSMSYEEYRNMQASHEHLCRCINAYELTSTRNHYDLVSMFHVFTCQEPFPLFAPPFQEPFLPPNPEEWFHIGYEPNSGIGFPGALELVTEDLKGKVVLPDVWTYYCINCMHVLPDLEFLEKKIQRYACFYIVWYVSSHIEVIRQCFTVVGVHFAKFDNEKDLEAIRNAILQYGITHPLWQQNRTVATRNNIPEQQLNYRPIYHPGSKIELGTSPLEKHKLSRGQPPKDRSKPSKIRIFITMVQQMRPVTKQLLEHLIFRSKVVNDGDMFLWRELGVNSWPTYVVVGPNDKLLAQISGEGRQKVVTDLDGNFIIQIGSTGEEGFHDGSFEDAAFNRPQKNLLYGVDTENRALRVINFVEEMAGTLAGNGTKGSDDKGGGRGTTQARILPKCFFLKPVFSVLFFQLLNSPWDVCFDPVNKIVYIALAGQHQIWEHNTLDGVTIAFSGNGYERNLHGSRY